jgi:CBS domain-containing protein
MSSKYLEEILNLPVQTNMRTLPPTASLDDPVSVVVNKMVRENIGAVIIVDENKPTGILTEKDILDKVVYLKKDLYLTKARDVMSEPIFSIEADHPIKEALDIMKRNNIRRLPVTKDGVMVGIVSERRLLEVAFLVT